LPPTVSHRRPRQAENAEAGFSLTELIAGLLVASLLVVGLIDITSRYARTTNEVRSTVADQRTDRLLGAMLRELERADPGSIVLTPTGIRGQIGGREFAGRIESSSRGRVLNWSTEKLKRSFDLPDKAHFEHAAGGVILLTESSTEPPIAAVTPRRTIPFDCQFDTVSRVCRS
jgi:hypothetical protein